MSASQKRAICIGVFDSVHLGHQKILRLTARDAAKLHAKSTALTFDPHPTNVLSSKRVVPMIFSLGHRLKHLAEFGVSQTHVIRFTKTFAQTSAEDFVRKILVGRFKAISVTVGEGFRFGRMAKGDTHFLKQQGRLFGFRVNIVKPVKIGGVTVSSTRIRRLIEAGRLSEAARLSGRPVSLYGSVVCGKGRGRRIGFPTLNLRVEHETLPPQGVYAALAVVDGLRYVAALHLGPRPTFAEKTPTVEAHLLDVRKDFYGKKAEIFLFKRLRSIVKFGSTNSLHRQISRDVASIRRLAPSFWLPE